MDDLISREETLKAMDTWDKFGYDAYGRLFPLRSQDELHLYVPYVHYADMVNVVKGMPSAQKTGKWITGAELNGKGIIPPTTTDYRLLGCRKREFWTNFLYCSVCYKDAYSDTDYGFQLFDFCPFCGARMVGEEE